MNYHMIESHGEIGLLCQQDPKILRSVPDRLPDTFLASGSGVWALDSNNRQELGIMRNVTTKLPCSANLLYTYKEF